MRIKAAPTGLALFLGVIGLVLLFIVASASASGVITITVMTVFYGLITWQISKRYHQAWWFTALMVCAPLIVSSSYFYLHENYFDVIRLDQPAVVQGIPCQGKVKLKKNGRIDRCTLSRDFTLSKNLLPAESSVSFTNDGVLHVCWLSRETTLSGQILPAGTGVYFTPEGHLNFCYLPRNTVIQGHLCKGRGTSYMTAFHPDGTLKNIWLARDEEIQSVPCASGFNTGTYFHDNGKLQSCTLSRDFTIQGRDLRKGSRIEFDREGKLK